MQGFFSICKTISVIQHINKLKNKNHITISRKSFWQNSAPSYDKNCPDCGHIVVQIVEGTYLSEIKAMYKNPAAKSISSKIRNKTRRPALASFIQHSFGSCSHSEQRRKKNKGDADWKGRRKCHCLQVRSHFSRVRLFFDPVDYSPPGSTVHGILQTSILEWVAIPFYRGSSWPRDKTHISSVPCTVNRLSRLVDNMTLCQDNPKNAPRKLLKLINESGSFGTQNWHLLHFYTLTEENQKEKGEIPFTMASKRIKYLGIKPAKMQKTCSLQTLDAEDNTNR